MVAGPLYLESAIIRQAERFLSRLDHVIIGGSVYTSELYRALGLGDARTPAIPYGIDTDFFTPPNGHQRAQARAEVGVTGETFVVIMVAYVYAPKRGVYRGRGIKGHDVLLEAWRDFVASHPNSRLMIVGGGFDTAGESHRDELMRRFDVVTDPTITWVQTVADVRAYYAAADLSVSPSLSENHGAALEAGSMGLPRIVSDAGALPETANEQSDWVVRRGDADDLRRALESAYQAFRAGALAERGLKAREMTVRLFDVRKGTKRVVDVIERAGQAVGAGRR
jgi:glycosyltransferase involved in cell wall biosynthesis